MTTANAYLNDRLSWYTPPSGYFDAARVHRGVIETRLDLHHGVKEMFETGSLRAGTGVRFYSDADYLVCLKGERPPTGTSALTKVKTSLADRFPSTVVKVRSPAVVCEFAEAKETVEVVPAYAEGLGYWIPDPATGGWMKTHPKDHNAYVNEINKSHSGGAKKLARLAKVWKYKRSVPVSSCYLEMRAAKYTAGQSTWWLAADLHGFLKHLQDISLAAMNDPTGLSSRFTACSSESNRTDALSKLSIAVTRASKAWDFDKDGKDDAAVEQLKLLLNQ
jgi:Second Messenger Oligonucleotide or Dinucleotide Synthetase domain